MIRKEFNDLLSQCTYDSLEKAYQSLLVILSAMGEESRLDGYRHYYGARERYHKGYESHDSMLRAYRVSADCFRSVLDELQEEGILFNSYQHAANVYQSTMSWAGNDMNKVIKALLIVHAACVGTTYYNECVDLYNQYSNVLQRISRHEVSKEWGMEYMRVTFNRPMSLLAISVGELDNSSASHTGFATSGRQNDATPTASKVNLNALVRALGNATTPMTAHAAFCTYVVDTEMVKAFVKSLQPWKEAEKEGIRSEEISDFMDAAITKAKMLVEEGITEEITFELDVVDSWIKEFSKEVQDASSAANALKLEVKYELVLNMFKMTGKLLKHEALASKIARASAILSAGEIPEYRQHLMLTSQQGILEQRLRENRAYTVKANSAYTMALRSAIDELEKGLQMIKHVAIIQARNKR